MEIFAEPARLTFAWLIAMGVATGVVALLAKGRAAFEGLALARRELVTNLILALCNGILLAPLLILPAGALHGMVGAPSALVNFWKGTSPLFAFAVAFLLSELAVYWRHRIEHHPLLWRFHATHHADEHLHWLSVLRKHPVSSLLSRTVDVLPLLIIGLPPVAVFIANVVRSAWGYFIHCDVPWTLGQAGRWLMSPAAHRLHHIRDEALMGTNYGNTVTLWDRVFGTYCDPAPFVNCATGIEEGTRDFLGELARPWERRYRLSWLPEFRGKAEATD